MPKSWLACGIGLSMSVADTGILHFIKGHMFLALVVQCGFEIAVL